MSHAFTWDIRGRSPSGRAVIYKQYSKLFIPTKADALLAAERDVDITRELIVVHPDPIVVIDVAGVKLTRNLSVFVKHCIDCNMPRVAHIHVVNCPTWANAMYKMVKRILGSGSEPLASMHKCPYEGIQDSIHAI